MQPCSRCGTATQLVVNGIPLCLDCDALPHEVGLIRQSPAPTQPDQNETPKPNEVAVR